LTNFIQTPSWIWGGEERGREEKKKGVGRREWRDEKDGGRRGEMEGYGEKDRRKEGICL